MSAKCLNCETELLGSFCHKCGQKSSTHRITFGKFVKHDLIHGVFHLDKGVLYTLKTLIYTPGHAARSFISGKRVMHYNIFALFIIIIALKTLVDLQAAPGAVFVSEADQAKISDDTLNHTIRHYYKLFYLLSIPLLSVFSFLFLRRPKYNFVEHIVLNCFLMAGGFFYGLIFSLIGWLTQMHSVSMYTMIFMFFYLMVGYYQCTKGFYIFIDYLWRALSILILFIFSLLLVLTAIIFIFYDGSFTGGIYF